MSDVRIEAPAGEPLIVVSAVVAAPPELTFALYTEPEHLRNWLGPRRLEFAVCEADLRVGGRYRYVHRAPDGQEFTFTGSYLELDPPRRLVRSFLIADWAHDEAIETITFDPIDGGTTVRNETLHPTIQARDDHLEAGMETGVTQADERLSELLEAHR